MSHAVAQVKCADGAIYHAEYNGTSDVILPWLYVEESEMLAHWRRSGWLECKDSDHAHETAEYAEDYGGGSHGPVAICRACMCITDVGAFHCRWDYEPSLWSNGLPDWWLDLDAD